MIPSPVRVLVVAATVLAAVVGASTPAAAEHPIVLQPFSADSGDNCRYGTTEGTLAWAAVHPPETPSVAVSGTVSDRPLPADPGIGCPDDFYRTMATFQAFTGNLLVDSEAHSVNNGRIAVDFRLLPPPTSVARIDRVVITVCRESLVWVGPISPSYCGKPQTYVPPNASGAG